MIPLTLAQIAQVCGGELRGDVAHPVDPDAVVSGAEPYLIVGAMAGG